MMACEAEEVHQELWGFPGTNRALRLSEPGNTPQDSLGFRV